MKAIKYGALPKLSPRCDVTWKQSHLHRTFVKRITYFLEAERHKDTIDMMIYLYFTYLCMKLRHF